MNEKPPTLPCAPCHARYVKPFPRRCLYCRRSLLPESLDPDDPGLLVTAHGTPASPIPVRCVDGEYFVTADQYERAVKSAGGQDFDELDVLRWMPRAIIDAYGDIVQPLFSGATVEFVYQHIDAAASALAVLGFMDPDTTDM